MCGKMFWQQKSTDLKLLLMKFFSLRIPHELQAPKIAVTWPTENIWVIMQQDLDRQKFQNIEESRGRIGEAYCWTSKIQTIHDDVIVHQLPEADLFGSLTWARCRAISITYWMLTSRLLRPTTLENNWQKHCFLWVSFNAAHLGF